MDAEAPTAYAYVSDGVWWTVVAPGTYQVEFSNAPFRQWATGAADRGSASAFTATSGEETLVDDVLTVEEAVSLQGVITDAATGDPIDACVTVYRADTYDYTTSACSGSDGTTGRWQVYGLPEGVAYKIEVASYDGVHLGEWAQDAADFYAADEIVTPATVDVALAAGGTMTGTLRGTDGQPVEYGQVMIEPVDGSSSTYAPIEFEGRWQAAVAPGDYRVQFWTGAGSQWAVGASNREEATVFSVASGETVEASDQLLAGASVEGTITNAATGEPVANACVDIVRMPVVDWPETAGQACTDESGHYTADLWDGGGTFTARVSDPEGRFVQEYYDDHLTLADADSFTVTRGTPVVVDAALSPGATITGLAVDAKLGTPLEGACPEAYVGHAGGRVEGQVWTCSDTSGRWSISGLPAGSYAVHLGMGQGPYPSGDVWAFKATSQATADLITVGTGATKAIRSVKIDPPVTISGRITDPFGNPVVGATVNPRGQLPDRSGECFDCARTDEDGRYTLGPLAAGTYRPVAYGGWSSPWAPEWVGNSTTYEAATPLTIKAGRSATFSAQLAPASTIAGEIVNADGTPASSGWIGFIESSTGWHMGDFDAYPENSFRSVVLPAGDFWLRLENSETGQVVWFDGATAREDSTVVSLKEGEERHITFHLPASTG
jgi:hypothetical protein